jgi:hypothetical protein
MSHCTSTARQPSLPSLGRALSVLHAGAGLLILNTAGLNAGVTATPAPGKSKSWSRSGMNPIREWLATLLCLLSKWKRLFRAQARASRARVLCL